MIGKFIRYATECNIQTHEPIGESVTHLKVKNRINYQLNMNYVMA